MYITRAEAVMDALGSTEDEMVTEILIKNFGTAKEYERAIRIIRAFETRNYILSGYNAKDKLKGIGVEEIGQTMYLIGYCLGRIDGGT